MFICTLIENLKMKYRINPKIYDGDKKRCGKCLIFKEKSEFCLSGRQLHELECYCRACKRNITKALCTENPGCRKIYSWKRRNIKITLEDYKNLLTAQNNKCAICNTDQSKLKKELAVDHNHNTGKVRGLLCNRCNSALGLLGDSKDTVIKAHEYLIRNQ